ncbi:UvrD-helicase domain-containing protein [Arcticibacter eurypsychrophilus]|uniref:UvrD-helicase domain-containing protein n=1 Tax=Arcticibacter eurypsychrophilus TaxID=1434752 RepID=UPI00147B1F13|nr:UvrD-helicase domain-containing protein [Arcticibacter eurypsychrophilus]
MVRYEQLDDDQKRFVDDEINKKGNIWVKGFAGCGKSVMLVHVVRKKLSENKNSRIAVVVYTYSLIDMFKQGMKDIGLGEIPVMTHYQFMKDSNTYDYILVDEVQDLPADVLTSMKNRCNNVIVAGDVNQSIYDNTVTELEAEGILSARPFILTRIYRLTRSIMSAVSSLMPRLDIFSAKRDMSKKDVTIRLVKALSKEEEIKYVYEQSSEASSEGYSSAILLPKHEYIIDFANGVLKKLNKPLWEVRKNNWGSFDYGSLNSHLLKQGVKLEYVGNSYGSFSNAAMKKNTIIMTYHSAKGMDFANVFLPFLSNSTSIARSNADTLLMVAMTRSNENLFITYSDYLHSLVSKFKSSCQSIDLTTTKLSNKEGDFDFDF